MEMLSVVDYGDGDGKKEPKVQATIQNEGAITN